MKRLCPYTILLLFLGLAGCAPSGYTPGPYIPTEPASTAMIEAKRTQQNTINHLLQQGANSVSPMKEFYTLQAAYLLAEQGQPADAQAQVNQLNPANYTPETLYLAKLVHINILRLQGQISLASQQMQALQAPTSLSLTTQIISHELKANLYTQQGDILNGIRQHIIMDSLLTNPVGQQQNRLRTWELVQSLPYSTLSNNQQNTHSVLDGWLALGFIAANFEGTPELADKIKQWQTAYPHHPANSILNTLKTPKPKIEPSIKYKKFNTDNNYDQIALLLPLSGKFAPNAASIRDGFITAYNNSGQAITLKTYDTVDDTNVIASYQQAIDEGADLVIGPLTKGGVAQINSIKRLDVPVVSLNYSQTSNRHPGELFEFGLAPEDEARQAARAALQKGHHRALVLVQADEWGGRVSRSFIDEWYRLSGQPPIKAVFSASDNINDVVRQALKIQLTSAQKERLTSQPQRRQDIDMIFLATQANIARQIKPSLDFYYANDLPVYGTSSIYALPPNPALDRDLDGVYVCDMPWLLSPQSAEPRLHATIDELWPNSAATYARFFALGIDAFNISSDLTELEFQSLPGVTGELFLAKDGRIERKVQCAQFRNGKPS